VKRTHEQKPVDVAGPAQDVAGPTPNTAESLQTVPKKIDAHCEDSAGVDESITPPHGDTLKSKLP
jgi:hypothetical protein